MCQIKVIANGTKVREKEFDSEYADRTDIFSSYTRNIVYRIGDATIFVMHTESCDGKPKGFLHAYSFPIK